MLSALSAPLASARRRRVIAASACAVMLVAVLAGCTGGGSYGSSGPSGATLPPAETPKAAAAGVADRSGDTSTPITHLVVIFDENVSFDHYFASYPQAANTDGTPFTAAAGTPTADDLLSAGLLRGNPNAHDPARLGPAQSITCDQDHSYAPEQKAENGGAMDEFVQNTENAGCDGAYNKPGLVMDYYDGNTVTALWNYAQRFSLSDNSWDTVFGPSTPGAIDLISGQTHGALAYDPKTRRQVAASQIFPDKGSGDGVGTVIDDLDPAYDDCSDSNLTSPSPLAALTGTNIGELLNARDVTWGWFQGGFAPDASASGSSASASPNGRASCTAARANVDGQFSLDYSPHHDPFQYYAATANPHHLPPTSAAMVGRTDQANHQYDLTLFDAAAKAGTLPAVSFLKAPEAQDGHAGYSGPLDEQRFLVDTMNEIQSSPDWASTAVVIAYDDSDGWYDHVAPVITNGSSLPALDQPMCSSAVKKASAGKLGGYNGRCGPSQRLPLLVLSPYARVNHVDHTLTDQLSILKFIEDNWSTGRIGDSSFDASAGSLDGMLDFSAAPDASPLILDPKTGAPR